MIRIIVPIMALFASSLLIPGCVFVSADFLETRNLITKELGKIDVDTEFQLRLGPGLLSCAKLAVNNSKVDCDEVSYLKDIKNIQIGIYKLRNADKEKVMVIPEKIDRRLARKGYEPIVKCKEPDETVWVLTRMKGKKIKALYIIALDRQELILVEIHGRLDRIIERAIQEKDLHKAIKGYDPRA